MMTLGIVGVVSAVNGTTLTVTARNFVVPHASTVYTVDASNATVTKDGAPSTLDAVNTGDFVFVAGMVDGTTVTATLIRDEMAPRPGAMGTHNASGAGFGGMMGALGGFFKHLFGFL